MPLRMPSLLGSETAPSTPRMTADRSTARPVLAPDGPCGRSLGARGAQAHPRLAPAPAGARGLRGRCEPTPSRSEIYRALKRRANVERHAESDPPASREVLLSMLGGVGASGPRRHRSPSGGGDDAATCPSSRRRFRCPLSGRERGTHRGGRGCRPDSRRCCPSMSCGPYASPHRDAASGP